MSRIGVSEILSDLRRKKGLRQSEVAEYLREHGFEASQRSVSNWETGRTQPNADAFVMLCVLYDVRDVQAVFAGRDSEYSQLNDKGRQRAEEYIGMLSHTPEFMAERATPKEFRCIPLYDLPASAGTGQFLDSDSYELVEAGDEVPVSATFAIRIAGDSMMPNYRDGQTIFVRQQQTLEDGEIGIFLLNGNAYCKKLSRNGEVKLTSLNSSYAPIEVTEYDELRVIGKVVE